MSTDNIGFYEDWTKYIFQFYQNSSNTLSLLLVCSVIQLRNTIIFSFIQLRNTIIFSFIQLRNTIIFSFIQLRNTIICSVIQLRNTRIFYSYSYQAQEFLARLHEVQKSYCSHPGRTRSRSRSRHTLLKFSRSLYLDNQLSESIHTWTIGTL